MGWILLFFLFFESFWEMAEYAALRDRFYQFDVLHRRIFGLGFHANSRVRKTRFISYDHLGLY